MNKRIGTARKVVLAGIILNNVVFLIEIVLLFVYAFLMQLPPQLFGQVIGIIVMATVIHLLFGIILPILGYIQLQPATIKTAAVIFIFSGILTLQFIGGILLLLAGAVILVTAYEKPSQPTNHT